MRQLSVAGRKSAPDEDTCIAIQRPMYNRVTFQQNFHGFGVYLASLRWNELSRAAVQKERWGAYFRQFQLRRFD
jgi:hypothetical protein